MPTENEWLGDAQPRRHKKIVRVGNVGVGDYFYLRTNDGRKFIRAVAPDTAERSVYNLLAGQMGESAEGTIPAEFREMTAAGYEGTEEDPTGLYIVGPADGAPIQLTADAANGEQPEVLILTTVEGDPGQNEKQTITLSAATGGTFTLEYDSQVTGNIAYNATAFTVRDGLCDLSTIAGVDEVQRLTSTATGGTFTVTFEGQTTIAIDFDAAAADIQAALEGLSNVAVGDVVCAGGPLNAAFVSITFRANLGRSNRTQVTVDNTNATGGTVVPTTTTAGVNSEVTVTGSAGGPFTVEFVEGLARTDVDLIIGDGSNLTKTGYGVLVTTITAGAPGNNEIQFYRLLSSPTGGSYTLNFEGQTTGAILYNDNAATVQAAMESLSNIAVGDVTVSGTPTDGFTVEFTGTKRNTNVGTLIGDGSSLTGGHTISVVATTEGTSGQNTIIRLEGPTLYQGRLFVNGIGYSASASWTSSSSAADVVAQLTASGSAFIASDFVVTKGSSFGTTYFDIEFTGRLATVVIVISNSAFDSKRWENSVGASVIQSGSGTTADEVQVITLVGGPTGGTFTLSLDGQTTAGIAYNAAASAVQAALEGLSNIGVGDVAITGSAGGPWTCTFGGALGDRDINLMTGSGASLTGGGIQVTTTQQATPRTDEVQQVALVGSPFGGTFTLTFESNTTAAIDFDASTADVVTALEGLATIGSGDVAVSNPSNGVYRVTFQGARKGENVATMSGDGSSLSGALVSVGVTQEAIAATNEQQTITLSNAPTGGTFTLTFNSQTTSGIPYLSTAIAVQTALEALATPVVGDFLVTGADGGPWTVTFLGQYAALNVSEMTGNGSGLVSVGDQEISVEDVELPTGPAWITSAFNWSLGHTPADGEIWVFRNTGNPARYGLEEITTEPGGIDVWASYTGDIGLPDYNTNDYREWRPRRLKVGSSAGSSPIYLRVGLGTGTGATMLRFDFSDADVELDCYLTGNVPDNATAVLDVIAEGGTNNARIQKGTVSLAIGTGESSDWATISVGYLDNQESDATVYIGDDVSLTDITQTGGVIISESGFSGSWLQYAGVSQILGSGTVAAIQMEGGLMVHRSKGNLTGQIILAGDALLDFDQDRRDKVVSLPIEVYGDEADVRDTYFVATTNGTSPAALIVDYNHTTRFANLGRNVKITRSRPT